MTISIGMRNAAREILDNFEELVAGIALVIVVILVLYGVFNRYVLAQPSVWAPELAGLVFTWAVFLGASAAWKRNMHIRIDVIVKCLHPKARKIVRIITDIIIVAFLAYATYLAIRISISSYVRLSPVLRVPFTYVYAGPALAFASMFLRNLATLIRENRDSTNVRGHQ